MNDIEALRDAWGTPEPPSNVAYAQARAALVDRTAGPTTTRPATTSFRLPRMGLRLIAVGALAVTIAIGVTVVETSGGSHSIGGGAVANASEVLERAALAAANRPFIAPKPNQWIYTQFTNIKPARGWKDNEGHPVRDLIAEQQWHSADGKHVSFMWQGKWVSTVETRPQRPSLPGARTPDLNWPPADYAGLAALPTDPHALLNLLLRHPSYADRTLVPMGMSFVSFAPQASYGTVFRVLNSILRVGLLPPKLEAAIFRAMKLIPGVVLNRKSTVGKGSVSATGREVLVVGRLREGWTPNPGWVLDQVLLDPNTYQYLGELSNPVDVPGKPDCAKVECTGDGAGVNVLLTRAAVVDKAGQRP